MKNLLALLIVVAMGLTGCGGGGMVPANPKDTPDPMIAKTPYVVANGKVVSANGKTNLVVKSDGAIVTVGSVTYNIRDNITTWQPDVWRYYSTYEVEEKISGKKWHFRTEYDPNGPGVG